MFLGFLSKRTFNGFCNAYFRYCVRSYLRNNLIHSEQMEAEQERLERGELYLRDRNGNMIFSGTRESAAAQSARVSAAARQMWSDMGMTGVELENRVRAAVQAALVTLAGERGRPPGAYLTAAHGYKAQIVRRASTGGVAGYSVGGGVSSSGAARRAPLSRGAAAVLSTKRRSTPAVAKHGGLKGGAAGKWAR